MTTITQKSSITDKLVAGHELVKGSLFGDKTIREKAIEDFAKHGIPGRKNEEYRYLNIELLLKEEFVTGATANDGMQSYDGSVIIDNAYRIIILNGCFAPELSGLKDLPKGLHISDIASSSAHPSFIKHYGHYADTGTDPFIALNTAYASGGVLIQVAKNTLVEKPIQVIHIGSVNQNSFLHPRNLIVAEENSNASIIETFLVSETSKRTFTNSLTEIFVGAGANLKHYKIQNEKESGSLLNTTSVCQEKQSVFSTNNFTLGGSFIRNNLNIVLDAENIETHLNGLYITNADQVVDNHTLVDHRKPNCNSNELYKGIIEGKSSATFNGKIYVRKDAQKTNAFQSNKNILLSDEGTINTKPQLEIYADDVKCSHGTSTGKLDEDKIFYLRARGLSEASAKKLLMHAFASEVVELISIGELRSRVEEKIAERFK